MQTFITNKDIRQTAKELDDRRLGKQRVEAIQIAKVLLEGGKGWANHPAVKMWRGWEGYLVKVYLFSMIDEWWNRGKNGGKCRKHYRRLSKLVGEVKEPEWLDEDFMLRHKSNLVRKGLEYDVEGCMSYKWPQS